MMVGQILPEKITPSQAWDRRFVPDIAGLVVGDCCPAELRPPSEAVALLYDECITTHEEYIPFLEHN
jgi:hypothetical protein